MEKFCESLIEHATDFEKKKTIPSILFRMDLFGGAHSWGEGAERSPLSICHTYLTMIKLSTVISYLKKIKKIYESRDTPLEFSNICYFEKYRYRLHFNTEFLILLAFFNFLGTVLIHMVQF